MTGINHLSGNTFHPQICHSILAGEALQTDLGYSIDPVFNHYRQSLIGSGKALAYLQSIGLSEAVIENYQLGYSDRTLCLEMASGDTSEGASLRGFLQSVGLIRPTGHERFWGAVIVPVLSASGGTAAAYGRRFTKALKPRTAVEEFWSTDSPIPLFNASYLSESKDIVLCQNPLDALICCSLGQVNVVATMGLNGFSEGQLCSFEQASIESVTLLYENTGSGSRYAGLVAQTLDYLGIRSRRADLPIRGNLSSYIQHQPNQRQALSDLLSEAYPFRQTMESVQGDIHVS